MGLARPFRRIIRPFVGEQEPCGKRYTDCGWDECHFTDSEYAADRITLVRAFSIIEQDLRIAFNYVEPADGNLKAFSHRLYELLLRSCTEFEPNCRGILADNGYPKKKDVDWKIRDYHKIEQSSRLSEYEVEIAGWRTTKKIFRPFESWSVGHSLKWYQAYNTVKHNRSEAFESASLENVLLAVTGLLAILFSQFFMLSVFPNQSLGIYQSNEDEWFWCEGTIFRVRPPSSWSDEESYDFRWKDIKDSSGRFAKYAFS